MKLIAISLLLLLVSLVGSSAIADPNTTSNTSAAGQKTPTALTDKWLQKLGNKKVVLMIMEKGVLVLAAQDPSIVGKKYFAGEVFSESGVVSVYSPMDKKEGKSFSIPFGTGESSLVEVTDAKEEAELLRLGKEFVASGKGTQAATSK